MRRATKVMGVIGLVLLVATGVWLLIAPGQLIRYPSDLDKTAVAEGKLTLFLDPATGAARGVPQELPLRIERRVQVVESSGSQATVQETSVERVGPLPEQTLEHRYMIDRASLENIESGQAYAYTQENVTDRAPFYSINFPFDTGSGPIKLWKNEVGAAYEFRRDGEAVERDGVTLIPMVGTLTNAPAIPAYVDQLRGQGVAKELTAEQMTAQLEAQGIDLEALTAEILPSLTPAQRELVQTLLGQAVPIKYFVSVETRLLVEPETGAIVSLDSIDQTLTAAPDLAGFARLAELLSAPPLSELPAVQKATETLTALAETPPANVFTLTYGQTPESVADFAAYAEDKAGEIEMVETTIPVALGILAALVLAAAAFMVRRDRRRPPPAAAPEPTAQPPKVYA
jgi:Porin PorA